MKLISYAVSQDVIYHSPFRCVKLALSYCCYCDPITTNALDELCVSYLFGKCTRHYTIFISAYKYNGLNVSLLLSIIRFWNVLWLSINCKYWVQLLLNHILCIVIIVESYTIYYLWRFIQITCEIVLDGILFTLFQNIKK